MLLTVGEILGSHWTAIARLKLGSLQPVRCCPATVCHPHWVYGDKGNPKSRLEPWHQTATNEIIKKRPVLKLRCWRVSGTLKEDYTFFWQGKRSNEPREHGVGFAVRNSLLRMVEPGSGVSEHLLTLRLNFATGPVTLISVYAPTLSATPDTKDMLYVNLAAIIRNIPSK